MTEEDREEIVRLVRKRNERVKHWARNLRKRRPNCKITVRSTPSNIKELQELHPRIVDLKSFMEVINFI